MHSLQWCKNISFCPNRSEKYYSQLNVDIALKIVRVQENLQKYSQ